MQILALLTIILVLAVATLPLLDGIRAGLLVRVGVQFMRRFGGPTC